ncbi:MAG: PD-(D/E)XK nuclease family protein [Candidatus Aminicenantes bacterium]|nr:PD-(D/E)XK nuclease family protein [Candidatus Aminicenantes bacterium]
MSINRPYSISSLGSFSSCPLQYKFGYVDRVETEVESVEAFMGSRVHEALEELYKHVKNAVVRPKDWLTEGYEDAWRKNWHPAVKVVRTEFTADDYLRKGRLCLEEYYEAYHPFDQAKVVAVEERVSFSVRDGEDEFPFVGVIDRLDWNHRDKAFEIHDYKTSGSLMTQEEADADRQLALYQLALARREPEYASARLVWHFLLFGKEVRSSRTTAQLEALEREVAAEVRTVEEAKARREFPPRKSALCDWCSYQDICPLWRHPLAAEKMEVNAYLDDPGVKLVARYAELEAEKQPHRGRLAEIEAEQKLVEEAALAFARREKVSVIDGPGHQLWVTSREEFDVPLKREDPERWERLRALVREANLFEEVATVNAAMFNARVRNWPKGVYDKITALLGRRTAWKVEFKEKRR